MEKLLGPLRKVWRHYRPLPDLGFDELTSVNFQILLKLLARHDEQITIVQIGAHNGSVNDPIHEFVRRFKPRGVLVEPQDAEFIKLRENYRDCEGLVFEQAVIGKEDGIVPFYAVRQSFWREHGFEDAVQTQISSLDPAHIRRHVEMFGGDKLATREEEYLVSYDVRSMTISSLLAKHDMDSVDVLQIDAEGYDYEILKSVDWSTVKPTLIHYEHFNLSTRDRIAAQDLLKERGYDVFLEDKWDRIAVLKDD